MLSRPDLRQLSQRITARYHLAPLAKDEVGAYVAHRLTVAGGKRTLFPPSVISSVARLSKGIPRLINLLCDRALLGAYTQGKDNVDRSIVKNAAAEVFGETGRLLSCHRRLLWCAVPSLIVLLIVFGLAYRLHTASLQEKGTRESSPSGAWNVSLPGIDTVWWFGGRPLRERFPDIAAGGKDTGEFPGVLLSGDGPLRKKDRESFSQAAITHPGPLKSEDQGIAGSTPTGERREEH